MKNILKYAFLSLAVLAMPLFASAVFTSPATTPPLRSVKLQLSYNGTPLKSATLNVAKGTIAELSWKTAEGTKGCVNNWSSLTDPANSSKGTFTESRYFIITCYGIGTAQTAKLRVNIVSPDLSVSSVKLAELQSIKKNTYKAGGFKINATVKNVGGLASGPFLVASEWGKKNSEGTIVGGNIATSEAQSVQTLGKGGSVTISIPVSAGSTVGKPQYSDVYYRIVVDSANTVDEETKENNNSSKWFGPFNFE